LREVDYVTSALGDASERQRLLLNELSHRVKNLLVAVVNALASRSIPDDAA
jgi:two-component sensor histidine kinase